jgi:hypothetical protein
MHRIIAPLLLVACSFCAAPSDAADLAGQSRLGAVFAEPVPKARRVVVAEKERPVEEPIVTYAPEVDVPSIVHGYYGKPNSYYYRSYYGTKPETIFSRAPYGCGWYGYC